MAEVPKLLGAILCDGTLQDIYTVPALKRAVVSVVTICNKAAASKAVKVKHAPAGAVDAEVHNRYDADAPQRDTLEVCKGLVLATTDVLRGLGADNNVTMAAYGSEEDV